MKVIRDKDKCIHCRMCEMVLCPAGSAWRSLNEDECVGCGACAIACPETAIIVRKDNLATASSEKTVHVNGEKIKTSGLIRDALRDAGVIITEFPFEPSESNLIPTSTMPCLSGGCWSCTVKVDGRYALSCITPLHEGMKIELLGQMPALRVVSGFGAHTVGGVGTPYQLKKNEYPVEINCFTHGCNLRCPQCQNYGMAFTARGHLMDAEETARILLGLSIQHQIDRIAISGGESTLNPHWLLELIKYIRNEDNDIHIHVDTNGTVLTTPYIDQLVKAGMTELGVDLKGIHTRTFQRITGLNDTELADKYLKTSWSAVEYALTEYHDNLFLGIGIPYNQNLISLEEVEEMGRKIVNLKDDTQVCVLDYRGEFRKKELILPSYLEMMQVKKILNDTGLKTVIAQTSEGHIGP
ncbi:MAG: radical SAM protein [Methanobacterium formicicum]